MKRSHFSTTIPLLAASFFALAASASASDLGIDSRADAYEPAPAGVKVNWSGFYVGGAIGYGNANHDLSVQDYFKDYCSQRLGDEGFDPFGRGRKWTLENKNERFNEGDDWTNCDQVTTLGGGYETVTGDRREIASLDGLNSTGVVGDCRLGYDQQMGRFLFGLFGTYGLSNMDADGTNPLFG